MFVLGISCFFHDAAAALIEDGVLVAAAEEERFSRRKHDSDFPAGATITPYKTLRMTRAWKPPIMRATRFQSSQSRLNEVIATILTD